MFDTRFPAVGIWNAIDPGVDYCAIARMYDHTLVQVDLLANAGFTTASKRPLVIEYAKVYKHGKARTADIENLLFSSGWIAAHFDPVYRVRPSDWKAQVPKKIHHPRVLEVLTPAERVLLVGFPKSKLKHILDAVGIALNYCGRM